MVVFYLVIVFDVSLCGCE